MKSGVIPNLSTLKYLQLLILNNNNIYSTIPTFLTSFTSLVELYLDFNDLSGTISPELYTLDTLGYVLLFWPFFGHILVIFATFCHNLLGTWYLTHVYSQASCQLSWRQVSVIWVWVTMLSMVQYLRLGFSMAPILRIYCWTKCGSQARFLLR